jgi:hypothetical protein
MGSQKEIYFGIKKSIPHERLVLSALPYRGPDVVVVNEISLDKAPRPEGMTRSKRRQLKNLALGRSNAK